MWWWVHCSFHTSFFRLLQHPVLQFIFLHNPTLPFKMPDQDYYKGLRMSNDRLLEDQPPAYNHASLVYTPGTPQSRALSDEQQCCIDYCLSYCTLLFDPTIQTILLITAITLLPVSKLFYLMHAAKHCYPIDVGTSMLFLWLSLWPLIIWAMHRDLVVSWMMFFIMGGIIVGFQWIAGGQGNIFHCVPPIPTASYV